MSIAQSNELLKRVRGDERFRNRIITANNMMERMEIILSRDFDCTKDEVQMVLDKYSEEGSSGTESNNS